MLSAQERGQAVPMPPVSGSPVPTKPPVPQPDPAVQRAVQEREAARTSQLFSGGQSGGEQVQPPVELRSTAPAGTPETPAQPLGQGEAFLARDVDRRTVSPDRVRPPASPYVLQAGSVIPAALVTGLRSDLPGQVTAQVTSPVYDSPTGHHLLVPQGSKLIGQYDAEVGVGQERVLLVWNRLILPDGRSIVLERQPGADAAGFAGLQGHVDNHWGWLFRAGLLSTLLGVGAELGSNSDNEIARAIRDGAQESVGDAGQEVVRRQLEIRPTLTILPGHPVRVLVTRDLVLEPYGDLP
jgi:type IV secretion system protein VirB10